jgi:two-component system nitrate/nitrite response regulator NarL
MSKGRSIKVLLVDNHPLVIGGLRAILETYDHIEVVGVAGLAHAGLEIARRTRPQVVLMDINMPQLFRDELPDTRLLMLSMHDSREYISTSVLHGASGYILKDVPIDEIIEAIDAVAAGKTYFSSGVTDVLLERPDQEPSLPLTTREQAVLLLLADGKSNKDVAGQLDISVHTVETHRKNIKKKLGIATTAGLTRYAIDNGLIHSKGH